MFQLLVHILEGLDLMRFLVSSGLDTDCSESVWRENTLVHDLTKKKNDANVGL